MSAHLRANHRQSPRQGSFGISPVEEDAEESGTQSKVRGSGGVHTRPKTLPPSPVPPQCQPSANPRLLPSSPLALHYSAADSRALCHQLLGTEEALLTAASYPSHCPGLLQHGPLFWEDPHLWLIHSSSTEQNPSGTAVLFYPSFRTRPNLSRVLQKAASLSASSRLPGLLTGLNSSW